MIVRMPHCHCQRRGVSLAAVRPLIAGTAHSTFTATSVAVTDGQRGRGKESYTGPNMMTFQTAFAVAVCVLGLSLCWAAAAPNADGGGDRTTDGVPPRRFTPTESRATTHVGHAQHLFRQRRRPGNRGPALDPRDGSTTARGRACDMASRAAALPEYVVNPAEHGADPTGVADSTAALQHCVELLWNASRPSGSLGTASDPQLDLGGATLDLAGGVYLISSPIVFPTPGARNFQVRGGTLRAASTFPESRFLFELNYTEASYVENAVFQDIVFDGGRWLRGGGLCSAENLHVRVQGCWFLRFGTTGLFVLNGHELYVDDT